MMKNKFHIIFATLLLSPCIASAEKPATQEEVKSNFTSTMNSIKSSTSELIVQALSFIGLNYKAGGNSPDTGFDCSGFVSHVFRQAAGIVLPHNAYQISQLGQKISKADLQPGDLVFYNTLKRTFSHVGIYIGDDKFIHSPSPGRAVEVVNMKDSYWRQRFEGARRITDIDQEQISGTNNIDKSNTSTNKDLSILLH